jgi:hypothetical protein
VSKLQSRFLADNTVNSAKIVDGTVSGTDIEDGSIAPADVSLSVKIGTQFTSYVGSGGYASLSAALAAATAGSRILVDVSETWASALEISTSNIEVIWMPNRLVTVGSGIGDVLLVSGSNVTVEGLKVTAAASISSFVSVSGSDCYIDRIRVEVVGTGVTAGSVCKFLAGSNRNFLSASVKKTSGGAVTTNVVDSGTDNDYTVRG